MPPQCLPPKCLFQSFVRAIMLENVSKHHRPSYFSWYILHMDFWTEQKLLELDILSVQSKQLTLAKTAGDGVCVVCSKALELLLLSQWGRDGFCSSKQAV